MATKPYDNNPEGNPSQQVNDPAIAYQVRETEQKADTDINALKAEANRLITLIDNPSLLLEAINELSYLAATAIYGPAPTQYTLEELKEHLAIAREQSKQGLWITHEEMLRRQPEWKRRK